MVSVLEGIPAAFEVMVTVLVNGCPALEVSYFTPITPFAPGAIGSFE
jgi:hypothetical protein